MLPGESKESRLIAEALAHYTDAVVAVEGIEDESSDAYRFWREAVSASCAALLVAIDAYAAQRCARIVATV